MSDNPDLFNPPSDHPLYRSQERFRAELDRQALLHRQRQQDLIQKAIKFVTEHKRHE